MAKLNCFRAIESGLATVPCELISAGSPRDLPSIARSMSHVTLGCHPASPTPAAILPSLGQGALWLLFAIRATQAGSCARSRCASRRSRRAAPGSIRKVRASSCLSADALTKGAMIGGHSSASLLRKFSLCGGGRRGLYHSGVIVSFWRLDPPLRFAIYIAFAVLFASGAAWLIADRLKESCTGESGSRPPPISSWSMAAARC